VVSIFELGLDLPRPPVASVEVAQKVLMVWCVEMERETAVPIEVSNIPECVSGSCK